MSRTVPDLKGLNLGITPDQSAGKRLLVCFFDMGQRPSRNTVLQSAKRAGGLKEKEIVAVLVQATKVEEAAFKDWIRQNAIPFPVGRIEGDENKARFALGVRSLPWLVLVDSRHIVRADGFAVAELEICLQKTEGIDRDRP